MRIIADLNGVAKMVTRWSRYRHRLLISMRQRIMRQLFNVRHMPAGHDDDARG